MALKIRLRQQGRTNRRVFRLVVANTRSPRDGRYVEILGWYNPIESQPENVLHIDNERVRYWVEQGAEMSGKAKALIAHSAPDIVRFTTEREQKHRAKAAIKRKARKKKAAA